MHCTPIPIDTLHAGSSLMQSPRWAHVKRKLGHEVIGFDVQAQRERDTLLAIMQHGPGGMRIAYFPWAPRLEPRDMLPGQLLEGLSQELGPQLPDDTLCLRWDLPWESPYTDELPDDRVRSLRMNFGTEQHAMRKAPSDIQPTATIELDLSRSDAELLADMHPKTRYNIRLSQRRGVSVRRGTPDEIIDSYRLYTETMQRQGIPVHPLQHFTKLFETAPGSERGTRFILLIAERAGRMLATLLMSVTGDAAVYLYGASASEGRRDMPSHALQWEAIQTARACGCSRYDLFGIPPRPDPGHPLYGLYRFKRGFGGTVIYRRGCWDYPLLESAYQASGIAELARGGFHG